MIKPRRYKNLLFHVLAGPDGVNQVILHFTAFLRHLPQYNAMGLLAGWFPQRIQKKQVYYSTNQAYYGKIELYYGKPKLPKLKSEWENIYY